MGKSAHGEDEKGATELAVFLKFIGMSELEVTPGSATKRAPPEPDILCSLASGESLAFELAEACAPEFAAAASLALVKGVSVAWGADVSSATILKKLAKSYVTPHPVHLLLYSNGLTALPDENICAEIGPLLQNGLGPFQRVWFMGDAVHLVADGTQLFVQADRTVPSV